MTNREVLMDMSNDVLASVISCPNDLYGNGIVVDEKVECSFRKEADCNKCIRRWLSSSSTFHVGGD